MAVKVLDESMAPVAASLEEARRGNRLEHPNVVKIHYADVVEQGNGNLVMIAMDHHAAGSIVTLLNPAGFLAAPTAVRIATDVLKGLEYLHEQHLFHNDIKPSNILLGNRGEALLTDYGISCVSHNVAPVSAPGAYLLHRAPETTATDTISVTSDIYQVGLTLFRLLYGADLLQKQRLQVGAGGFERLKASGGVPDPQDYGPFVDGRLKRVIIKATAADPAQRYQSALEMRRALERIAIRGHWDVDAAGNFYGLSGANRFDIVVETKGARHAMRTHRQNERSGRSTRVSAHCHTSLSATDLAKRKAHFMRAVLKGEL